MKNQRKVAISPQNKGYSISRTSIYVSHKSEQWKVMQSSHNALCHNISRIGLWRHLFEDGCMEWATQSCSFLCGRHRRELFALLRFEWPVWRYSTFFAICTAEWSLTILVLWWRDVSLLLVCTWRHGGHVGGQEQKHFSPLGTKLYFHVNFSRKYSFVLSPNMAALSRGCKPRIKRERLGYSGNHYIWFTI